MKRSADVVVVGGGVIGCACARELAVRGLDVMLLERAELAAGASGRNHGLLLVPPDPALVSMAEVGRRIYPQVAGATPMSVALDEHPIGFLVVATDDESERASAREEADASAARGVPVEEVAAEDLRRLEPALAPDLVGGWLVHDGLRLDPAALTVALALDARAHGADVRSGVVVRALLNGSGAVRGVITDEGTIEAATVVVAAGPWSGALLRPIGVSPPITSARGWLVHLAPGTPPLARLVERAGWHPLPGGDPFPPVRARDLADAGPPAEIGTLLQPTRDGTLLVGGSRQAALTDEPEDPSVPMDILRGAVRTVPALADARVLSAWWGLRPMTPDGRPLVGVAADGLVLATGHGSQGVILGAGTAALVVTHVTGEEPPFDPAPFAPTRYQ